MPMITPDSEVKIHAWIEKHMRKKISHSFWERNKQMENNIKGRISDKDRFFIKQGKNHLIAVHHQ